MKKLSTILLLFLFLEGLAAIGDVNSHDQSRSLRKNI